MPDEPDPAPMTGYDETGLPKQGRPDAVACACPDGQRRPRYRMHGVWFCTHCDNPPKETTP